MMVKKGLGRGLDALFMNDIAEEQIIEDASRTIKITDIDTNKNQPRKLFYEDTLEELAESIRMHGIITPLALRRKGNGRFEIVAGERRFRAARRAGLTEVPAVIVEVDDKTAAEIALIENLQREDLNAVEEAEGIRALIDEFSMTQEEAAERLGKSRSSLANALRLLALAPEALALLRDGKIERGHAKVILALPSEKEQNDAAHIVSEQGLNVRQTEALVKRMIERKKDDEPQKDSGTVTVNYLEALERNLTSVLGRKVKLINGRRKGKIELEFYGAEDLEFLVKFLERLK